MRYAHQAENHDAGKRREPNYGVIQSEPVFHGTPPYPAQKDRQMKCLAKSWQSVGLKGHRLQKPCKHIGADPYFAAFLANRTPIGLKNRQNPSWPGNFFALIL
jgi:hypothetical protein